MRHFIAMTLVALAPMLAGCVYFIPSFAGHGGGGMKEYAEGSISVADMDVSLPFYQRLGFDVIEEDQKPHRRIIVSDGQIFLRLEQTSFDSPRLVYISSEAADRAERLQGMGIRPVEYRMPDGGTAKEFKDPNGIVVVLRHGRHPARLTWHESQIGRFGEISIETNDPPRSMDFWKKLGFTPYPTITSPPWPLLFDPALVAIGLHEKDLSGGIAITYFSKDLDACVRQLKAQGIVFATEETQEHGQHVRATLRSPDGQLFVLKSGNSPLG